jgi:hypothetical protein
LLQGKAHIFDSRNAAITLGHMMELKHVHPYVANYLAAADVIAYYIAS